MEHAIELVVLPCKQIRVSVTSIARDVMSPSPCTLRSSSNIISHSPLPQQPSIRKAQWLLGGTASSQCARRPADTHGKPPNIPCDEFFVTVALYAWVADQSFVRGRNPRNSTNPSTTTAGNTFSSTVCIESR
jgi:hypothetical protein